MKRLLLHTVVLVSFMGSSPTAWAAAFVDDAGERKRSERDYEQGLSGDLKRLCINNQTSAALKPQRVSSLQSLALWSLVKDAVDKGNAEILASYDALIEYLAGKGVVVDFMPHDFVDVLAKKLYLHLKSDKNIPDWLKKHIKVSVGDLLDNGMIRRRRFSGDFPELDLSGKYIADLTGLKRIPLIARVSQLYLDNNLISSIPAYAFIGLSNLDYISFNGNHIKTIAPRAFIGLSRLTSLRLGNNELTTLPLRVFEGLGNLKELMLGNNALCNLQPGVFAGLHNVSVLFLNNNQLTDLALGVFDGLERVGFLSLNNNKISVLSPGIFEGLPEIAHVWLDGNLLRDEEKNRVLQELRAIAPRVHIAFQREE